METLLLEKGTPDDLLRKIEMCKTPEGQEEAFLFNLKFKIPKKDENGFYYWGDYSIDFMGPHYLRVTSIKEDVRVAFSLAALQWLSYAAGLTDLRSNSSSRIIIKEKENGKYKMTFFDGFQGFTRACHEVGLLRFKAMNGFSVELNDSGKTVVYSPTKNSIRIFQFLEEADVLNFGPLGARWESPTFSLVKNARSLDYSLAAEEFNKLGYDLPNESTIWYNLMTSDAVSLLELKGDEPLSIPILSPVASRFFYEDDLDSFVWFNIQHTARWFMRLIEWLSRKYHMISSTSLMSPEGDYVEFSGIKTYPVIFSKTQPDEDYQKLEIPYLNIHVLWEVEDAYRQMYIKK